MNIDFSNPLYLVMLGIILLEYLWSLMEYRLSDSMLKKRPLEYTPSAQFSDDRDEAMHMLREMEDICRHLPGIDCGSCGAPTCMAFAEDIVKGETNADECTVIMRSLFHQTLSEHEQKAVMEKLKATGGMPDENA